MTFKKLFKQKTDEHYINILKKDNKDCWKLNFSPQLIYLELYKSVNRFKLKNEFHKKTIDFKTLLSEIPNPSKKRWDECNFKQFEKSIKFLYE